MIDHTGKYRIRSKATGLYLVMPIDAWGEVVPEWVRIPEAAMRFSQWQAMDQIDWLGRYPHGVQAEITLSTKMVTP